MTVLGTACTPFLERSFYCQKGGFSGWRLNIHFAEVFFKRIEVESSEILVHAKQIATNTTSFLQQDLKRRFEHPYAAYRVPLLLAQVFYAFAGSAVLTTQGYTSS